MTRRRRTTLRQQPGAIQLVCPQCGNTIRTVAAKTPLADLAQPHRHTPRVAVEPLPLSPAEEASISDTWVLEGRVMGGNPYAEMQRVGLTRSRVACSCGFSRVVDLSRVVLDAAHAKVQRVEL